MENEVKDFGTDMVQIPEKKFMIGRTPVTQELYKKVMGHNPSWYQPENVKLTDGENPDRLPVDGVSWYDAIYFCNKLSVMEGLEPVYSIGGESDIKEWVKHRIYYPKSPTTAAIDVSWNKDAGGYRLPTIEEWEYAAKGGTESKYSGSDNLDEVGWYDGNSNEMPHEVGLKKANGYGLYDMSGNVWELCWDSCMDECIKKRFFIGINWEEKDSYRRYSRGGSWYSGDCGVDDSEPIEPHERLDDWGFRIARNAN